MKLRRRVSILITCFVGLLMILHLPLNTKGDGCYIPVVDFQVYEPGQNAIVCWNGNIERLYLSINIWGTGETEGIHFVPFPSEPDVSLGNATIFSNITNVFEDRLKHDASWDYRTGDSGEQSNGAGGPDDGISIILEESLGVHDVLVIKVNSVADLKTGINDMLDRLDMEIEVWPEKLEGVIENYVARGFPYFALDRFPIGTVQTSIDPLIYEFETDEPVFPLEISSILNGTSRIQLGLIVPPDIPFDLSGVEPLELKSEGHLTSGDLDEIDFSLKSFVDTESLGMFFSGRVKLEELEGDFSLKRNYRADWMTTFRDYSTFTGIDNEGTRYQRILTSCGYWTQDLARLCYIDTVDGSIIWEKRTTMRSGEYVGRWISLSDIDNDMEEDIFIIDHNATTTTVERLDPSNGITLWSTHLEGWSGYNHVIKRLMGPLGNNYILVEMINELNVLDMTSGELQSFTYSGYTYSSFESIRTIPSQNGDLVFFVDKYESTFNIWDPWVGGVGEKLFKEQRDIFDYGYFETIMDDDSLYVLNFIGSDFRLTRIEDDMISYDWETDMKYVNMIMEEEDDYPTGFFYTLQDGLYEISSINIETGTEKWSILNVSSTRWVQPVKASYFDFDGDGDHEILLRWDSYINIDTSQKLFSKITIHDEETGEILWENKSSLIIGGFDTNNNFEDEILIETLDSIYLVEPSQNRYQFLTEKQSGGISYPFISEDMNSDGLDDVLFMMTDRSNYFSNPWTHALELTLFDGFTSKVQKISEELGAITNSWLCKNQRGSDSLIVVTLARIYSFPVDARMEITASKHIAAEGQYIDMVATAVDLNGIFENAEIEWYSTNGLGTFTETTENSLGIYSTRWTVPKGYFGAVTLTAEIKIKGISVSSHQMVEIVDERLLPDKEEIEFDVDLMVFPPRITIDGMVSISAKVVGNFKEENLELELFDIDNMDTNIEMFKAGDSIWMAKYCPRDHGEKDLVFKAIIDKVILWEEFINIMVINDVEEDTQEVPLPPALQIGAGSKTIIEGSSTQLFIILNEKMLEGGMVLKINDNEAGGSFSTFEELFPGAWSINYTAPFAQVESTVTVFIDLNGKILASESVYLRVIPIEYEERIEPELEFRIDLFESFENSTPTKHILISAMKGGISVKAWISSAYISEGSWRFVEMDTKNPYLIHLKVLQLSGNEGMLLLDLTDGRNVAPCHMMLSPLNNQDITNDENIRGYNLDNSTTSGNETDKIKGDRVGNSLVIILTILIIVAILAGSITMAAFFTLRREGKIIHSR